MNGTSLSAPCPVSCFVLDRTPDGGCDSASLVVVHSSARSTECAEALPRSVSDPPQADVTFAPLFAVTERVLGEPASGSSFDAKRNVQHHRANSSQLVSGTSNAKGTYASLFAVAERVLGEPVSGSNADQLDPNTLHANSISHSKQCAASS